MQSFLSPVQNNPSSGRLGADRFRALVEGFADPLLLLDGNQIICYANRTFMRLFGYQIAEVIGQPYTLLVPQNRQDVLASHLAELGQGTDDPLSFECHLMRRNGGLEIVALTLNLLPDSESTPMIMLHLHLITEQKRAELELQESEKRFSTAFFTSPVPQSIISQGTNQIMAVNNACCHLFGYRCEELLGANTTQLNLWENPADRLAAVEELQRTGRLVPEKQRCGSSQAKSAL